MSATDHRPVALFALTMLVGGGIAIYLLRSGYEPGGPLSNDRKTSVSTHQAPGTSMTWGDVLPTNPTSEDIVLESIEPSESVKGLTILGLGVSDPRTGAVGTADGYLPPGITSGKVAGTVMSPATGPSPFVQVVVGVRLDDPVGGSIAGFRVRYSVGAHRYETVLSDALLVSP